MRNLTDNQKEFILRQFFKNRLYAGWRTIATKLLESGRCVVAGKTCIWDGDVGDFIKTEMCDCFDNCLVYEFDLDGFLSSELYRSVSNDYISELLAKLRQLEKEYEDICNL